ncbi:carboxymuconolactone decarboxylase family protein [Cryptosporangium sp. NPDC048952]|uniref:carboxymuconolactone decarboxylase family protein n=1 Tax=Cryptosporangium sp. NPDC048952 TaxID=3363961 RepID=UPI003723385D
MTGYLPDPPPSAESDALFAEDVADLGYVMNATRLWAYEPAAAHGLFDLMGVVTTGTSLDFRRRAILVSATASAFGDPYCSLAWGARLAKVAGDDIAGGVLSGDDEGLSDTEQVMARWARRVALDPRGTSEADVGALRDAGFPDAEIFAMTVFIALRLAFSTVNNALGAGPDDRLRDDAPAAVRDATLRLSSGR